MYKVRIFMLSNNNKKTNAMTTAKWTHDNRDCVTVTAETPAQAWEAAEEFLAEVSEEDETTNYCTGLSGSEYIEESEDGVYVFRVKIEDK